MNGDIQLDLSAHFMELARQVEEQTGCDRKEAAVTVVANAIRTCCVIASTIGGNSETAPTALIDETTEFIVNELERAFN